MYSTDNNSHAIPIIPVTTDTLNNFLNTPFEQSDWDNDVWKHWVTQQTFTGKPDSYCLMPGPQGQIQAVLAGFDVDEPKTWAVADLPNQLPEKLYRLQIIESACGTWTEQDEIDAAIGWGLGCYRFKAFQNAEKLACNVMLLISEQHENRITAFTNAIYLVRDLINTPANHMMPEQLSYAMSVLAREYGAAFMDITGELLIDENYPMIHAVGRASVHSPRLLEMTWGDETYPRLTLVGKGVCFDSGGLDLKPSKFMRQMKKDMGGAAHVLGLANLIIQNRLPVHLRVLIPAVENAVSGDAFRPGDVITARSGKTVEIDNTDAEGRLVLCDALTDAASDNPDLIVDFATLTGAARVALGTEVPVYFTNTPSLAHELTEASEQTGELVWQLPLHQPYFSQLKSDCADILNCSPEGYGGAITAALFLKEFVPDNIRWAHFDVMAWNNRARSGRPKGGEAMGLMSVYHWLEKRYATERF